MSKWPILLLSLLLGCGGSTPAPYSKPYPQPGNVQPFDVVIYNGTQWEIQGAYHVSPSGSYNVDIVPKGKSITYHVNWLPTFVRVKMCTTATPTYCYPDQVKVLGVDYSRWATKIYFTIQ